MKKAIHVEESSKNVVRVLSIAEPEAVESSPTGLNYFLIEDYEEPEQSVNHKVINYPMYNKLNKKFMWFQVKYQATATPELADLENLKVANLLLQNQLADTQAELATANENINMLIELQADILGGAI